MGEVLVRADELRVFPRVVNDLLAIKEGRATANRGLKKVVAQDAVIAGRIVRLANSAFYGQKKTVAGLDEAIKVIGLYPARDLALSLALATTRADDAAATERLWSHVARVAVIARVVSGTVVRRLGPTAFLAGLLHDIGRLLLMAVDGERYARLLEAEPFPSTASERAVYGYCHADLGGECLREWQIPDDIVWAVMMHHREAPPSSFPMRPRDADVIIAGLMLGEALDRPCATGRPDLVEQAMVGHPACETLSLGQGRLAGLARSVLDALDESQLALG